jgi:hypothetical protein
LIRAPISRTETASVDLRSADEESPLAGEEKHYGDRERERERGTYRNTDGRNPISGAKICAADNWTDSEENQGGTDHQDCYLPTTEVENPAYDGSEPD